LRERLAPHAVVPEELKVMNAASGRVLARAPLGAAADRCSGRRLLSERALCRLCRVRVEVRIVAEEGGAIGADDFVRVAHIQKDVGMIKRRLFAYAHEFLCADFDHRHAGGVVKVRNDVFGHNASLRSAADLRGGKRAAARQARGTITARLADS
jgi:hypothetical protein